MKKFDFVIYGATSFVGRLLVRYMLETVGVGREVNWAIAGRSEHKLKHMRDELGGGASEIPILVAELSDDDGLNSIVSQSHVIVSTAGPYARFGEPLVKACVMQGIDYCDLTGEVQWIAKMQKKYGELAKQTGARVIHCCGYDSIPSDFGVYFLQKLAKERHGEYCEVVSMRVYRLKGGASGGTLASMMQVMEEAKSNRDVQKILMDPYALCTDLVVPKVKQTPIFTPQYDSLSRAWVMPFIMAGVNEKVVLMSHNHFGWHPNFRYHEAMLTGTGFKGALRAYGFSIGLLGLIAATAVPPLKRWLSQKLPSGSGPSPSAQSNGYFIHHVYGHTATQKAVTIQVKGDRDPGYGSTAKMLGQAVLCLRFDSDKFAVQPKQGGFWTPSSLMGDLLLSRLQKFAGLSFSERL